MWHTRSGNAACQKSYSHLAQLAGALPAPGGSSNAPGCVGGGGRGAVPPWRLCLCLQQQHMRPERPLCFLAFGGLAECFKESGFQFATCILQALHVLLAMISVHLQRCYCLSSDTAAAHWPDCCVLLLCKLVDLESGGSAPQSACRLAAAVSSGMWCSSTWYQSTSSVALLMVSWLSS